MLLHSPYHTKHMTWWYKKYIDRDIRERYLMWTLKEEKKKEKWNSILSITNKLINMDYINLTRIFKERRIWQPHLYSFTPPLPLHYYLVFSPKSILSVSLFNPAFAHWYLTSPLSMYISVSICIFWHRKKNLDKFSRRGEEHFYVSSSSSFLI